MAPRQPAPSLGYRAAVVAGATALAALAIALRPAPQPVVMAATGRSASAPPTGRPPRDLFSALQRAGWVPSDQGGGGDCLFRALSHQLYRTPANHLEVRAQVADEIAGDRKRYEDDVAILVMEGFPRIRGDPFDAYVAMLRRQGFIGDAVAISAFSRTFKYPVRVFLYDRNKPDGLSSILFETYEGQAAGPEKRIGWIQSGFSEAANHFISVDGESKAKL